MKNITNKRKNTGFTLLELVVVVAVMGLISSMAMDVYTDNSNQKRFEATKERLAEIKFAIIGDPMMRMGNQRVLNGFFHDTQSLPNTISELIYPCIEPSSKKGVTATDKSTCTAGGNNWVHDNWNGPYLTNIQSDGNELVFRDAWGNNSSDGNFGWLLTPNGGGLVIQTKGLNRNIADTEDSSQYELDYPSAGNLINKSELETALKLKGLASDSIYLSAVNTKAVTNSNKYCLVIKSAAGIYISENITLNLEQNQPQTLSFSNFKNHTGGSPLTTIPFGDYTYEFYHDSSCPAVDSNPAPAPTISNKLYIKQNGNFSTLKSFS